MQKGIRNWMVVLVILAILLAMALLIIVDVGALSIQDGADSLGTGIVINVSIETNSEVIDSCMILDKENRTYYLDADLQSLNTCFVVEADNVKIDGLGHSVVGDSRSGKYAIKAFDVLGLVVENITIKDYQYAIFLDDSYNSTISGINVNNENSVDSGIKLRASDGNIVDNSVFSGGKYGIEVQTGKNNIIRNNVIQNAKYGISVGISRENLIEGNEIDNGKYGIYTYQSTKNTFLGNSVQGSEIGFYASQSAQNKVIDSLINSTNDVVLEDSSNSNEFLGSIFNDAEIEAGSNLIRSWHVAVNVKDSTGVFIEGAHVSVINEKGYLQFSDLTDANGKIDEKLTEYTDNGRRKLYSDYSLTAEKEGYENEKVDFSINDNIEINITFVKTVIIKPSGVVITNISVSPELPLGGNGSPQQISIDFDSSVYPINLSLMLFNENWTLFDSIPDVEIQNKSMLPFVYTLPELPDGSYAINLTFKDAYGNSTTFTMGSIDILRIISNETNNTGGNETNNNTGGGDTSGGGGGGHGGSSGDGSSSNVINLTNVSVGEIVNETLAENQTGNETTTEGTEKGTTITGAIINALDKARVPLIWIFIVIVVVVYLYVSTRQKPGKETEAKSAKKNGKS